MQACAYSASSSWASAAAIATTSSPSPSLLSSSSSSSAMLDHDPNPPRPPDSSSRPRPRPHKPKNAPKKQPQRGLGVAQLEKLRLEEQSKQEAACLASLHHHRQQQQQQQQPQPHQLQHRQLLQHHLHQQQQLPQAPSPLCLPRPVKLIGSTDPVPDKPAFSLLSDFVCSSSSSSTRELTCPRALLSCGTLNCGNAHNSFVPLAGMDAHSLGTVLVSPQQRSVEESEPCWSSLTQAHNLCSPGSAISGTISPSPSERSSSKQGNPLMANETGFQPMSAPLLGPSNLSTSVTYAANFLPGYVQTETARQNHDLGRESGDLYVKAKDPPVTLSTVACFCPENGMEGVVGGQNAENGGTLVPFRELCLQHPSTGPLDASIPSRNRLESPVVSIATTGIQPRELSSFQTFSITPAWSCGDQVLNRKRPWVLTQDPTRNLESFKVVDLNTSADEMESESTEGDSPGTDLQGPSGVSGSTSVFRDAWAYSGSPILNPGLSSSTLTEENTRLSTLNRTYTDCKNVPEDFAAKMYLVSSAVKAERFNTLANGAPFLSIRKASSDYDAPYIQEVETCGEFLTLGPSSCLNRTCGNMNPGIGNYSFPKREARKLWHSNESATIWQPQQPFLEQAKGVGKLLPVVSKLENIDTLTTAKDVQNDSYHSPLQINVGLSTCLAWTKVEDHSCRLHPNAADEGPLDLELRLSL